MWQAEGRRLSAAVISPYLRQTLSSFTLLFHSLFLVSMGDAYDSMITVTGVATCCIKKIKKHNQLSVWCHLPILSTMWVCFYFCDITNKIAFIIHSGVEEIRKFSPAAKSRPVFSVSWILISFLSLSSVTVWDSPSCQETYWSMTDQGSR